MLWFGERFAVNSSRILSRHAASPQPRLPEQARSSFAEALPEAKPLELLAGLESKELAVDVSA